MRVAVLGLLGFVALVGMSAALYPGGTVFDPTERHYSFFYNYWCDLLSPVALGGAEHALGAWLARAGFASFALALWQFWPLAAGLAGTQPPERRLGFVVACGRFGAISLLGVSALPPTVSELGHALLVASSAGASIMAALVLIPALSTRVDVLSRWLGWGVTASCTLTLVQYLQQGLLRLYFADWLPGAQKVTTLLLLAWMTRLLWRASARRSPPPKR